MCRAMGRRQCMNVEHNFQETGDSHSLRVNFPDAARSPQSFCGEQEKAASSLHKYRTTHFSLSKLRYGMQTQVQTIIQCCIPLQKLLACGGRASYVRVSNVAAGSGELEGSKKPSPLEPSESFLVDKKQATQTEIKVDGLERTSTK